MSKKATLKMKIPFKKKNGPAPPPCNVDCPWTCMPTEKNRWARYWVLKWQLTNIPFKLMRILKLIICFSNKDLKIERYHSFWWTKERIYGNWKKNAKDEKTSWCDEWQLKISLIQDLECSKKSPVCNWCSSKRAQTWKANDAQSNHNAVLWYYPPK